MKSITARLSKVLVAVIALSFLGVIPPAHAAGYSGNLTINFHYQRADQTFNDWKAWVWCGDGSGTWGSGPYQATGLAAGTCTNGAYLSLHDTTKVSEKVVQFTINNATNVSQIGVIMYKAAGSANCCGTARDAQSASNRFITLVGNSTDVIVSDSTPSFVTSVYTPPTPSPTPTSTATTTTTATPSPSTSTLNGNFTVTIHYANSALVSSTNTFYSHVWLTDSAGNAATGIISEGSDPRADKDGMDSYGAVLKLNVSGAVDVSKIGIIQYSIAKGDTTNTWIKDAASTKDRFIDLIGDSTEVWMRSAALDTAITYGPGSLTQPAGTGDPLLPNRPAVQTFKIHYNRSDGAYDGWKLYFGTQSKVMRPAGIKLPWIQSRFYDFATPITVEGPTGTESSTVGVDGFGPWVQFTLPYYAGHADWANMVIAKEDWSEKDGGKLLDEGNRYISTNTSGTTEVWLLSGDTTSNGGNCAYSATPFGPPTVSELAPVSAYRGGSVTVSGSNLWPVTLAAPAITSTAAPLVTVGGAPAVVTGSTATSVIFEVPAEATTGTNDVIVNTAGGAASKLSLMVLHDPPTFVGVSPDLIHRGDVVIVTGANFEAPELVRIGNTSATIDPSSTDTELKFTVPTSVTPGTYSLTVTSKWGTTTKPEFITVVPDRPTVTSFSPKTGKAGDTVTITGTNLTTATKVEFASQEADFSTAVVTDTSIQITVPVTIPGTIKVTTTGGDVITTESYAFQADAPTVTSVDPAGVHRGQLLTIFGTNLLGASVTIGGVSTDPSLVTNNTSDSITVSVPADVEIGPDAIIIVTTSGGSDATASVTILPDAPFIESLSMTEGGVGDILTINGTALAGVVKVTFNGDGQSDPVDADLTAEGASVTDTAVTVIVPDGVTSGTITVTDFNDQTADSAESFMVYPKPELTTVQTIDGLDITVDNPVMRGDTVVISGVNFGNTPSVKVGDAQADVATDVSSDISVQFTVPNGAPFGATTVAVRGPGGSTTTDFFVQAGPPTIDAISANVGKSGDLLTISGLNLYVPDSTIVTFNGDGVVEPVVADLTDPEAVLSDFSLTVRVPEGVSTGTITITTSAGEATSADLPDGAGLFTIAPAPTIDSLSATSGRRGASITITGTNLTDGTVKVGDLDAEITETPTDTLITFIVPDAASIGDTAVTVVTVGGTADSAFTVLASPPTITRLSATTGRVGVSVTITGTHLSDAIVKVRGVRASLVDSSDTSIVFTVPNVAVGVTTLNVTTTGGSAVKTFTVIPLAPKISAFAQSKITKRGVGTVTVTGTNLAGATVKVGTLKATVKSAVATKIIFVIPSGAKATTKGTFTITTAGGSVTSRATLKITLK